MKRAAAIIGPTPSFVRWAIRYDCDFRQLESDNLPYDTFRQLRSLRELSIGRAKNRIVDGFCLHADFNQDVKTARGFPIAEIFDLFGDQQHIEDHCGSCPANCAATEKQGIWAGCFGWFFSQHNGVNWIEKFEECSEGNLSALPQSAHVWFRVWQIRQWGDKQLGQLLTILNQTMGDQCNDKELVRFYSAVKACIKHRLLLETELMPRGHSDGLHWITEPRCARCCVELKPDSRRCDECGAAGSPSPAQKKKVLGLRPYMLMKDLVGEDATAILVEKFHVRSKRSTSD